ncbi:CRE-INX-5 protein [Caenorhabditis remanei]|uniref:Innexin n=1 Tax=Caenorhabditis remanei TaxID=31234 RepID=E3MU80_CAERE|nr:CRE-INX-5 protein [Caenorhabditis remanei]
MIGVLLPYVRKFQRSAESNDIVDRFSYQYTSTILGFSAIMMAASQYVGRPIQCWVPAQFTRTWEKYAETYCFIKGTYFLPGAFASEEEMSVTSPDGGVTASAQVGYYQWIPIILFVQAFLFYLPSIIWRTFNESCELKIKELAAVSEASRKIKSNMSDDQVKGRKFGRYFFKKLTFRNESPVFKETGKIVASGKFLPSLYLLVKILYLANIVLQFWILTYFLDTKSWLWGWQTFQDLVAGREWETTGIFPRVTMCDFSIMDLTTIHDHSIQCVIVINMLAEKVYVFFWFWLLFVGILTGCSLLYWTVMYMLQSVGRNFIYSYLQNTPSFEAEQEKGSQVPAHFVDNCLTADGVFISRLVQQNSGDLFTSIMLEEMFNLYRAREAEKAHKKNDDNALPPATAPLEIKDEEDDDIPLPPPTKAVAQLVSDDEDDDDDDDVDSPDTTATLPR